MTFSAFVDDIGERRLKAESQLQLIQFAFDHASDAAYFLNSDGSFIYVNESACRSLGYSREALLQMRVQDVSESELHDSWEEHWQDLKTRGSFSFEAKHRRKDGSLFPVEITVNYVEFDGLEYNCAFVRDITERKSRERRLRETEKRYRDLFEHAPLMYLQAADKVGSLVVTECNEMFLITLDYQKEEVTGQPLSHFYTPESQQLLLGPEGYQNALKGEFKIQERELLTKTGSVIQVLVKAEPIFENGEAVGTRAIYVDISERKKTEAALARRSKILVAISFSAGELLKEPFWEKTVPTVLEELGKAIESKRVCLFEIKKGEDGTVLANQLFEWTSSGIESVDNTKLQSIPCLKAGFGRWLTTFEKGEIIEGWVSDFPHSERQFLKEQNIDSLLAIPIQIRGSLWGFMGFEQFNPACDKERDALVLAANTMGAAIERRFSDDARLDAERRYRDFVENINDVIFALDVKGGITYISPVIERLTSYKVSDLVGRPFQEFIHPDDYADLVLSLQSTLAGNLEPSEYRIVTREGAIRWVRSSSKPVYDGNEIVGLRGVLTDITATKVAEDARVRTLSLQRATLEATADGILVVDRAGRVVNFNERFLLMWSIPRKLAEKGDNEKLLSHVMVQLNRPEAFLKKVRRLYDKPTTESFEVIDFKDGRVFERRSHPQYVGDQIVGRVFSFRDVTETKRAESALRKSEERYRRLFEDSRDMVYVTTREGNFLDINQAGCDLLGYSREELLSLNATDVYVHVDSRAAFQNEIEKYGSVKDFEVRLRTKSGEEKFCILTSAVWQSRDGHIKGYHGILKDVTTQRRLQKELQRAHRLESAGKLAAQIAHDFNNLLSPIAAYPSLIRDQLSPDHPAIEMLDDIEFTANKIAEINQQLLALGRRGHYNVEPVDLNILAHKVILTQKLPNDVVILEEMSTELFLIKGGEAQLTRALLNLVKNAVEAMQGVGNLTLKTENVYLDKPLVGYKTINLGEYVKLSIADTGCGIQEDSMDKIFDPFFTTKTMDRERGSGLGLSVVHGIIEDTNGYITVESTPDEGSVFTLYFPVAREYTTTENVDSGPPADHHNESILVVDDDPMQRRVIQNLLKKLGYNVKAVTSGEEAVDYVKRHTPNLLLLDMVMDGIDGTETYRQILDLKPTQKAIILSGYAMSERVREALRLGVDTFVSKPIIPNTLSRTIRTVLDKKVE